MNPEPVTNERRELTRPRDGRMAAGVARGIASYLGVSVALVRLAFAALVLAGGAGLVLYLAGTLVIPAEGERRSIAEDFVDRHRGRPVLLGAAAAAALVVLAALWTPLAWGGGDAGAIALLVVAAAAVAAVIRRDREPTA
jgi:phage shock protein PspC (stress-responsive transcriptional regulator)